MKSKQPLLQLAGLFLKLSITAFGGPVVHIAMMHDEVVNRRKWLTDTDFLDLLAATNLIPGPNSTELALHIGYKRCGLLGLITAGTCFILPTGLIVGTLAWGYTRYGDTPETSWLMYGISPVIIAIVLKAIWKLGNNAIKNLTDGVLCISVAMLSLSGINEIVLLVCGSLITLIVRFSKGMTVASMLTIAASTTIAIKAIALPIGQAVVPFTLTRLTLFFVKVGSILFGSGYVLLVFLRADLTERWGWLTEQQLIDAITIGQISPGPISTTATFIGYILGGWVGAVLATVGIFIPGFIFVAATQPLIPRLRSSKLTSSLLNGIVVTSLGLMLAVTWHLTLSAIIDFPTIGLALGSALALTLWKINATWVILGGAITGWLLHGVI